jgi:hypothetical protein
MLESLDLAANRDAAASTCQNASIAADGPCQFALLRARAPYHSKS